METPILYINTQEIENAYLNLKKALPGVNIAYAIKANPEAKIINHLADLGAHFETASSAEINHLLSLGIKPKNIIFSNPVKSKLSIDQACRSGVNIQAFDSLMEIEKFRNIDQIRPVMRLQVPNEGSLWPLSDKFGCPPFHWDNLFKKLAAEKIPLTGFTFHVGSQAESLNSWDAAMQLTLQAWKSSLAYGLNPELINFGGGFPIFLGRNTPSINQIAERIYAGIDQFKKEGLKIKELWAEPGRYIVGSAGYLFSKVIGVAKREKGTWVFLDCGVFSGMMETIDGITYPIKSSAQGKMEKVTLCGPSCDSVDTMFEVEMNLPDQNDIICFNGTGAYTNVYASQFNGFMPPETKFIASIEDLPELESSISI